jgi:hypothetical protein
MQLNGTRNDMRPKVKVTNHGDPANKIATTAFVRQAMRGFQKLTISIDECPFWKYPTDPEEQSLMKLKVRAMGLSESLLSWTPSKNPNNLFVENYNG